MMLSPAQEKVVRGLIDRGHFASEEEAITAALRLLADQVAILDGNRRGIKDLEAGRSLPADEVFAEIRREFNLAPAP